MNRQDIIRLMARAMHEQGYTSPYESLSLSSQQILEDQAEAALEALEDAQIVERSWRGT
jgi:hypothetical protein